MPTKEQLEEESRNYVSDFMKKYGALGLSEYLRPANHCSEFFKAKPKPVGPENCVITLHAPYAEHKSWLQPGELGLIVRPPVPMDDFGSEWELEEHIWVPAPLDYAGIQQWFYLEPRCSKTLWLVGEAPAREFWWGVDYASFENSWTAEWQNELCFPELYSNGLHEAYVDTVRERHQDVGRLRPVSTGRWESKTPTFQELPKK